MRLKTFVISLLFAAFAQNAYAEERVDLALVLAVDVSGSVVAKRYELQMRGYSAAFRSKDVQGAITSGPYRSIAVMMVHWSGPTSQMPMTPWTIIRSREDATAYADALDAIPRAFNGGSTSISGALAFSVELFADAPLAARKVIDVSGDGANNSGPPSFLARDHVVKRGVIINGLPIITDREPNLDAYYRQFVIGGEGAFLIAASSYDEFATAIRRKLVLEIAGRKRTFAQIR